MNDSSGMCRVQSVSYLDAQIEYCLVLQRSAIDPVPERQPLQQFHGDEGSPFALINLINRADVRVVEGGRSFGFPLETAEGLCVVGEFVGQELQGDVATELEVFSFVDHTHAPAPDLAEDAVMGDCFPHGFGRSGHWRECYGG